MKDERTTLRIGAHVSVAGGVHNAVQNQLDVGGNCGQIFTHSPQVWEAPKINDEQARAFREATETYEIRPWVIHSSYLVNLCSPKPELREKSIDSLQTEVRAAQLLGIEYVNVHLGAHTGAGVRAGLDNAVSSLDELDVPDSVTVLIENDAGSGTKLGGEFEHLASVIDGCSLDLGVCLDTAHAFASAYDLSTPEGVQNTIGEFARVIGTQRLKCIHLNDSEHQLGTNEDGHAPIGEGYIGHEGFGALLNHEATQGVPFILETSTPDPGSVTMQIVQKARLG